MRTLTYMLQKSAQAVLTGLEQSGFHVNGPEIAMSAFLDAGENGSFESGTVTAEYSGFSDVGNHSSVVAVSLWTEQQPQWGRPNQLQVSWVDRVPADESTSEPVVNHLIVRGWRE